MTSPSSPDAGRGDVAFAPVLHHRTDGLRRGEPIAPPIVTASTYLIPGAPEAPHDQYGRWDGPTWRALEHALSVLEDAEAVIVPSGMAAIAAVLLPLTSPGDRILLPSDGYGSVRALAEAYLVPRGVEVDYAATSDVGTHDLDGYALVHLETPSNPGLRVADIADVARRAHAAGARVVVDNTTLTPLGQRPLDLGADVVVASDTKALNGHSDALGGHVAARDPEVLGAVRQWRTLVGGIPGAHEAALVHRGLETLEVRLERMCASAQAVAELAERHPAVRAVRYPGLASHPDHAVVRRQMRLAGPLMALEFVGEAEAEAFIATARWVVPATSFGGTHTSAERRARWGDDVPAGFVRLAVGCEPTAELLADLEQALDTAAGQPLG